MAIDPDVLLPQCYYRHLDERSDALYLTQPVGGGQVETWTFAEVFDQAARMAAHIRSLELPPQSKIAIISKNCAHFFMADLAIWLTGHVSVALYPTFTAETIGYILNHCEAKLLFVGKLDSLEDLNRGLPEGLPCIAWPLAPETPHESWDDVVGRYDPIDDRPRSKPDDEALIIYTSGSTGRPKGVVHSFENLAHANQGIVDLFGVNVGDRMLSYLPLAHAMDRWGSEVLSMYVGHQIYFAEAIETFVADLNRAQPTLFVSVPRLWLKFQMGVFQKMPSEKLQRYLKIPILSGIVKKKILRTLGLDRVRIAVSGSAPIPAELMQWYRDLGLELLEGYGMSENFNYSHMTRPGHGRVGYVGNPWPDVECRISEDGEIQVKGPTTMVGYYKDPEQTRETFTEDGFLKTGDRGEVDRQGRLKITGRVKDLFKTSKGKYVAPVPIENVLNNDERVELSCVIGASQPATCGLLQLGEDARKKARSGAGKQELTTAFEHLLEETNAQLPNYEQMAFLVVTRDTWDVDSGELTPSLKIKRATIEDKYAPKLDEWFALEQKVIWES